MSNKTEKKSTRLFSVDDNDDNDGIEHGVDAIEPGNAINPPTKEEGKGESRLEKVKLSRSHRDNGTDYEPGQIISVDKATADYIERFKIGSRV